MLEAALPSPLKTSSLCRRGVFSLSLFIGFLFFCPVLGQAAAKEKEENPPPSDKVEAVADQLEYQQAGKKIIGRGNVVVTYGPMKMTADYAEVETETKKVYARGHVVLLKGATLAAKGEEVFYDLEQDVGRFPGGKSVNEPWFVEGKEVEQVEKGKLKVTDAGITTCDRARPHYQIRAKQVTVYTGNKIQARSVTFYVLGKPVFWWPYLSIPLQEKGYSPFHIQPGYSSRYGGYLLTSKGFSLFKWLWARWHADWRSKRGFGGGVDLNYQLEKLKTTGSLKTYMTQDHEAPSPSLANPYSETRDHARGRLTWRQRTDFDPHTNLILRFHQLSDEFFLQDFFQREFRADVEPTSFMNFTHNTDRYGFYAFNQSRIRGFENVTERLPDIRLDWKNAPFLSDRVYYESRTSFANLNQKYARKEEDNSTNRFDSFHEWSLPVKWKEIKLTPSANFGETLYSRGLQDSDFKSRTAFGVAMDLRTHFYRVFDKTFDFWGIEVNQLRHVFEPSIRHETEFLTTAGKGDLFEYDAIDSLANQNRIVFGLENRIQTKRVVSGKLQRVDLISLNTFLSLDFHPPREFNHDGFTLWSGEFQFRPYEWFQYETRFDYDVMRNQIRELNQDLILKTGRFRFVFGHRWVETRDFLNAPENNQFVFDGSVGLNERWRVGGYIRWDAVSAHLEEWQISATRDMHDFLLDFGYNVRSSLIDNSNKELFFLFRLKAFPEFPLRSGNRASFAEPRIGTTVAGSNQFPTQPAGAAELY